MSKYTAIGQRLQNLEIRVNIIEQKLGNDGQPKNPIFATKIPWTPFEAKTDARLVTDVTTMVETMRDNAKQRGNMETVGGCTFLLGYLDRAANSPK